MAQHPLFAAPPRPQAQSGRLGASLHGEVFGALPFATARALDVPEVAMAVRSLLERRWRPVQLAARVGALPAGGDPVGPVVAFLTALRERDSPQQTWEAEREDRKRDRVRADQDRPPASDAVRAHWAAQARRGLAARAGSPSLVPPRTVRARTVAAPACAACDGPGERFVTREVRLCTRCVSLLQSGTARLSVRARAG